MADAGIPEHGTRRRYLSRTHRCRCAACQQANTAAMARWRRYKAMERHGAVAPRMVDAEPVRRHVRALMAAGMGWERIAATAGVGEGAVAHLLYGQPSAGRAPSTRVTRTTAERLFAVVVPVLADGARIDATGTRRRLQALVAVGWTGSAIMRHLGKAPTNFYFLIQQQTVEVATARAVRALYERLWNTTPPTATQRQRGAIVKARRCAAERGWPPPMAWDDTTIDDPAVPPAGQNSNSEANLVDEVAVDRAIRTGDPRHLTQAERAHLAATLLRHGESRTKTARILRCSSTTLDRLVDIADHPTAVAAHHRIGRP